MAAVVNNVFLQPGEYFVGDASCRIRTLLGSCVSITLWHPVRRIGAMSHFLLPNRGLLPARKLDGRYGDEAMLLLLQELSDLHIGPTECVAKIFGGGNMFPEQTRDEVRPVGLANGAAAHALLQTHQVPVLSECLFGVGHRQIIFDVSNGNVWVRRVKPTDARPLPLKKTR
jgi:chemotaxis protein CheD